MRWSGRRDWRGRPTRRAARRSSTISCRTGIRARPADLPPMALVDMPGYGYASAPKEKVDEWTKLVFDYLKGRVTLKRVYVLIDARHGIKKNDEAVLSLLDKAAVSYQLVLTKADKIKAGAAARLGAETLAKIGKRPAAYPAVLATSSEKGEGIEELAGGDRAGGERVAAGGWRPGSGRRRPEGERQPFRQ